MKDRISSRLVKVSLLAAFLLLAAAVPALAQADGAGWVPMDLRAGRPVDSLALVPEAPGTLLATSRAWIYRSAGEGPWVAEEVEGPSGPEAGELHTALNGTGPVFLRSFSRLYRREGDSAWALLRDDLIGHELAVAPRDPSRLYLATFSPDVSADDEVILRGVEMSRDGGETWTEGAPLGGANVPRVFPDALAVGHQSSLVVYVLLSEEADKGFPAHRRLLRSDDGGATWAVETVLPEEVSSGRLMEVAPDDDATLYLALRSGLYRTTDGGVSLEKLPATGLPTDPGGAGPGASYDVRDLVLDPNDSSTLYAAIRNAALVAVGGVYRSTDGGSTWSRASDGLPAETSVLRLVFDPEDPATLYAATPRGVFRSTNGGGLWAPREPRLPTPITEAAVDPARPSRIYAGSGDERLFASDDGGQAWSRIGAGLPGPTFDFITSAVTEIAIAPGDPSILLVDGDFFAERPVLGRSLDRGETFDVVPTPGIGSVEEIVFDSRDPDRVLASASRPGGLFESTDRGLSWRLLHPGQVFDLLQAPSDPSVFYIQHLTPPPKREFRVCRSGDGGESWSCPESAFRDGNGLSAIVVDPRDASTLLATRIVGGPDPNGQDTGPLETLVHRSADGGESWSPAVRPFPAGTRVVDLAIDPRAPETVWAASTTNGVFRSTDGGDSWQPLSRGLERSWVDGLVFGPGGRVLLATTPDGLYRFSSTGGPAPPPELPWISDPALPGFRIKVRIAQGAAPPISGTKEPACIPETVCLSGALPGRSEVFVRMVGPKPNGFLWPTLVKFTTSRVEVWIQQLSTGEIRHYELRGASPGFDELPGLFDRDGFLPE